MRLPQTIGRKLVTSSQPSALVFDPDCPSVFFGEHRAQMAEVFEVVYAPDGSAGCGCDC